MKRLFLVAILAISFVACQTPNQKNAEKEAWKRADQIIQNLKDPIIPNKEFRITDFGAIGDGTTLNTEAINKAVAKCNEEGGGHVIISGGTFLTGPIHLKSNVDLHIEANAKLVFSTNPDDYLPLVRTRWEGDDCYNYSPLIYANGQENFSITGKGTLDGQGSKVNWWPWKGGKSNGWLPGEPSQLDKDNRPLLKVYDDTQVPVEKRQMGPDHYLRPQFINFIYCKNVKIEGITLLNSPFWVMHPLLSENVIVRNVTVNSMGPNNDGCDPESCKNVLIEGCTFNTGDDCIALKSGRDFDGRKAGKAIENVIVRNCHMKNGHGGVALGSEIAAGCKDIFVENCQMDSPELDRAIRIKSNNSRGGVTDGVFVRKVNVGEVSFAVVSINCSYHINTEGQGKFPPLVKNVYVSDMASQKATYALWLQGLKGDNCVKDIYITNCNFSGVKEKNVVQYVENLNLKNVTINGEPAKEIQ